MTTDHNIKQQRDRFLSFSFATSDLLLEVNDKGLVQFAMGAVQGLTGNKDANALIGQDWVSLFNGKDRMPLKLMLKKAQPGLRCGPELVSFQGENARQNILVSAIKMPEKPETYISIATCNDLVNNLSEANADSKVSVPLDKESFVNTAQETMKMAAELGQEVDMTLIDIPGTEKARKRFKKQDWEQLTTDMDALICDSSIDGNAAANLGDGRYGVVHDSDFDLEKLQNKIEAMSRKLDPFGEGLEVKAKSISTDMSNMDEHDATRALFYTLSEFERDGTEMQLKSIDANFKDQITANTKKIQQFKDIINKLDFTMHFQPIVDLSTGQCSHYEMLARFREGNTFEWVMFGEDIGMAAEFDMAVFQRSIRYITEKKIAEGKKFSINISGQSISNPTFFEKLVSEIKQHEVLMNRILFEITESTQIKDLEKVSKFVHDLQKRGFHVALDDFGAGAASFQYLSSMDVDYVKIDGKYIKNITNDKRDMIMVKNLTQMCKDLDIKVVGEFVENKEISDTLKKLGVDYGQGYYFSKPEASPDYAGTPEG